MDDKNKQARGHMHGGSLDEIASLEIPEGGTHVANMRDAFEVTMGTAEYMAMQYEAQVAAQDAQRALGRQCKKPSKDAPKSVRQVQHKMRMQRKRMERDQAYLQREARKIQQEAVRKAREEGRQAGVARMVNHMQTFGRAMASPGVSVDLHGMQDRAAKLYELYGETGDAAAPHGTVTTTLDSWKPTEADMPLSIGICIMQGDRMVEFQASSVARGYRSFRYREVEAPDAVIQFEDFDDRGFSLNPGGQLPNDFVLYRDPDGDGSIQYFEPYRYVNPFPILSESLLNDDMGLRSTVEAAHDLGEIFRRDEQERLSRSIGFVTLTTPDDK